MGWMIMPFMDTLVENIDPTGLRMIVFGGCVYTSGIYFFVTGRRKPSHHVIWHMFVLVASAVHYLAILWYGDPLLVKEANTVHPVVSTSTGKLEL